MTVTSLGLNEVPSNPFQKSRRNGRGLVCLQREAECYRQPQLEWTWICYRYHTVFNAGRDSTSTIKVYSSVLEVIEVLSNVRRFRNVVPFVTLCSQVICLGGGPLLLQLKCSL